jgi:hypothetical protein
MGLARVLDRRSRISANSHDPSLEPLSAIRLSVSEANFRPEAGGIRPEGNPREMIGESSMNAATASEIARLKTLTITQIVRQFESLFGEKCRSRNKRYLIRRIAWRLQANAEGELSERAKARAAELALDSEVRVTPPRETSQPRLVTSDVQSRPALDQRLPPPGSMLHRDYKGRQIRVLIVNNRFEYEGQLYKSLTAVANAITGSHVNGFQFFGLGRRR